MIVRCLAFALIFAACAPADNAGHGTPAPVETGATDTSAAQQTIQPAVLPGDGLVVWESNRSGAWRLWARRLDGNDLQQLTGDEPGRSHCCPHFAPDGSRLAFLSIDEQSREYPGPLQAGELRLIDLASTSERSLGLRARTYFENRAVVWRSASELIYIDEHGGSQLLDLDSGERQALLKTPADEYGWLIDGTLRWSVSGRQLFGQYDRQRRQVVPGRARSGCQPYFTHDGRWGFWMPAPGGPIEAVELASGKATTVVQKSDPRLPAGLGYLYFPMYSADQRLLAFAASPDEHDHFRADYEIFVAPTDPETLELVGNPVRLTTNPATDRYPDVYLAPLALGRHRGEAPYSVRLTPRDPSGSWTWSFGDDATAEAAVGEHTFSEAGTYTVRASQGDLELQGQITVVSPAPPRVVAARPIGLGDAVRVDFDEPVALDEAQFTLASGLGVERWSPSDDGRAVTLELVEQLRSGDVLQLRGVVDRAQAPNRMAPTEIELAPPLWPSRRENLVFLWQTADAPNLVYDAAVAAERTILLERRGRARLDRDYAMVLSRGAFTAPEDQANALRWALEATNEMTLEMTLTSAGGDGRVVSFSSGGRGENFSLTETSGRLVFGLRLGSRGPDAVGRETVATVEPGRRIHVVVTYAPGHLRAYVDGDLVTATDALQGGFFHWRSYSLTFGDESSGGADWSGTLEGVAIYDRALDESEIRENYLRSRQAIDARTQPPRVIVDGRLKDASRPPSLEEIAPYREALAVFEYDVEEVLSGEAGGSVVRVAEWVIADGEPLPSPPAGSSTRLVLEPFSSQPQLDSVYLANTLPPAADGQALFYAVSE